jgi:hypothetical protein
MRLSSRLVWQDAVALLEMLLSSVSCAATLVHTRGWATLLQAYHAPAPTGDGGTGGALSEAMRGLGIGGGQPVGGIDAPNIHHLPPDIKSALLQAIYTPAPTLVVSLENSIIIPRNFNFS